MTKVTHPDICRAFHSSSRLMPCYYHKYMLLQHPTYNVPSDTTQPLQKMWVDTKSEVTAVAKHQVMKAYVGLKQNILIFLTLELN
jgi:hypothetical protein